MMQNLTVQKLCIGLITLGFFVFAPWLVSEMIEGNAIPFFILLGTGGLFLFLFVLKDRCWMIIPFSLPIEGRLNFLPLNFSMQEAAVVCVVAYIFIQVVMGRQIHWRFGPKIIWLPLSGLLAILLFHWVSSGDIGIRALGGTGWGGRKYVSILLAVATIPLLSSFSGASWRDFQKIPLIFFAGVFMDLIPDTLTTLFPGSAPYVYRVYSAVNIGEFGKTLQGNFGGFEAVTRFTPFRILGQALCLVILSYFPFYTWLNPARLWIPPALVMASIACAFSGFRSALFNFSAVFAAALFATARIKAFLLVPAAALVVFFIAATQGSLVDYPRSVQRAFSFLPGNWEKSAAEEAAGSSKWRDRIRELFFLEYFKKAPLLGTGFGFDPDYAKRTTEFFLRIVAVAEEDEWADVRSFLEMKQPHEGDIFALQTSGVIGTAFFIAFCLATVWFAGKTILMHQPSELAPVQIWAFAILFQQSVAFFTVFGDYWMTLSVMCPVISILGASERMRNDLTETYDPSSISRDFSLNSIRHPQATPWIQSSRHSNI